LRERATSARRQLELLDSRRVLTRPFDRLHQYEMQLDDWERRLTQAVRTRRQRAADEIGRLAASLNALSPLGVLERGYSITQQEDGTVLREADNVKPGEIVTTRLHRGTITARVESAERGAGKSGVHNANEGER
jgi:exodeoxyribonuclease VII large subunit